MWKRSYGYTIKAPPDERGGNRYVQPKATAPHLDSTMTRKSQTEQIFAGLAQVTDISEVPVAVLNLTASSNSLRCHYWQVRKLSITRPKYYAADVMLA